MSELNEKMAAYWNEQAGPRWVRLQERLDQTIQGIGLTAVEAAAPRAGEAVLDVGCGCGATLLELAARVSPSGRVHGVDVSEPMLARARERLGEAGIRHVRVERADAQVRSFDGEFDLVFSRFGVMFFGDPPAAFANLLRAARPGGRLAFACWRARELNPWMWTAFQAAGAHVELPEPLEDPHAPGPFGLHDGERLRGILEASGWAEPVLQDLDVTIRVAGGAPLDEAVDHALEMGPLPDALAGVPDDVRARVREVVREALAPHETERGVEFPGAARIVTARRPAS